jgi:hypothetical protein
MTDKTEALTAEKQVWRECRHSLPPYEERVLISWRGTSGSSWRTVVIGRRSYTSKTGEHWVDDQERPVRENIEVYAWMPLPEACNES